MTRTVIHGKRVFKYLLFTLTYFQRFLENFKVFCSFYPNGKIKVPKLSTLSSSSNLLELENGFKKFNTTNMPKELHARWEPGSQSQATKLTISGTSCLRVSQEKTTCSWPRISAHGVNLNEVNFIGLSKAHGLSRSSTESYL